MTTWFRKLFQQEDERVAPMYWRDLERAEQWTADQALGAAGRARVVGNKRHDQFWREIEQRKEVM